VLERQGKYEEAKAMHRQALKGIGPERPDTLASVNDLGSVLPNQGKYEEAEVMHRRDLEGSEKTLGQSTQTSSPAPTTLTRCWRYRASLKVAKEWWVQDGIICQSWPRLILETDLKQRKGDMISSGNSHNLEWKEMNL